MKTTPVRSPFLALLLQRWRAVDNRPRPLGPAQASLLAHWESPRAGTTSCIAFSACPIGATKAWPFR